MNPTTEHTEHTDDARESPQPPFPPPSGRRARVAQTVGLALLASVAGCLVAGAVLALRSGPVVDPGWEPAAAFAWATLWLPAGCRLAVPALLLIACARAAAPAGEGRRGRAWRIGVALAAFSAVRLVLQCFAMASFADSGSALGRPAADVLNRWFACLSYPLSEAALVLAGLCLPGLPAEDPAAPAENGAGRAERRLFLASAACLALLLVLDVLRVVRDIWFVLLSLGHTAVPVAACLALGALARRASGRERWRLPTATPVALFLAFGACLAAVYTRMLQWNGIRLLGGLELLIDLFYLAWPVWLCFLVCSRPHAKAAQPPPPPAMKRLALLLQ